MVWPILLMSPEPSTVIAATPPASLIDPPSSSVKSPSTVMLVTVAEAPSADGDPLKLPIINYSVIPEPVR